MHPKPVLEFDPRHETGVSRKQCEETLITWGVRFDGYRKAFMVREAIQFGKLAGSKVRFSETFSTIFQNVDKCHNERKSPASKANTETAEKSRPKPFARRSLGIGFLFVFEKVEMSAATITLQMMLEESFARRRTCATNRKCDKYSVPLQFLACYKLRTIT